jgi:hypothetical protein
MPILRIQRRHVLAIDREALAPQQIAQHAAPRERMLQMQLVDAPHQHRGRLRRWWRPVVHRRARHVEQLRLAHDRQRVGRIDHRFALASPIRPSAPAKKSISSACSPILACSAFKSGPASRLSAAVAKLPGALEQLGSPLPDLVGMDFELPHCPISWRHFS